MAPAALGLASLLATAAPGSHAASGQVVVNPDALSQLKPSAPAADAASGAPTPPRHPAPKPPAHPPLRRAASSETKPAAPASRAPAVPAQPVTMAPAPPPPAALSPAVEAPPKPVAPPPPVPVVNDATGVASVIGNGVRITFGATSSDLNGAMVDAIRAVARTMAASDRSEVNLYAFSSGPVDDPSTPRRLALQRALAVRAMLISEGIASTRIYPRVQPPTAAAANAAAEPADRVDMVISTPAAPAAAPAPTPPAASPATAAPAMSAKAR